MQIRIEILYREIDRHHLLYALHGEWYTVYDECTLYNEVQFVYIYITVNIYCVYISLFNNSMSIYV